MQYFICYIFIYFTLLFFLVIVQNNEGEFDWDRQIRGLIQSSFFIGYLLTMIPSGFLVQRISTKWGIFAGVLIMTVATFLSPPAARLSPYMLMVMQIFKGLGCVGIRWHSFVSSSKPLCKQSHFEARSSGTWMLCFVHNVHVVLFM